MYVCIHDGVVRYKIADDQETFSLWGRNLKIFKSKTITTVILCMLFVFMYVCMYVL